MERVLLGMSGGVDSSMAAYLLQKEGYEVVGITMTLIENASQIEKARNVANKLNIEFHTVDYKEQFKKEIIDNFINSYKQGKTPNPCVLCNKFFKFGLLYQEAQKLNCKYIATGHYAKVENGLIKRIDSSKDQTYFLNQIHKEVIPHILFPLNNYPDKDEIRKIAYRENLVEKSLQDSEDICFIKDGNYKEFISNNSKEKSQPGKFIFKDGTILGNHEGIINYTIGQRRGLGLNYHKPLFVINIDYKNNNVILGEESDLYKTTVYVKNFNLLTDEIPENLEAKIRYNSKPTKCTLNIEDDTYIVTFKDKVKSPTNGQYLVLYSDHTLIGGGVIVDSK